MIDLLLLTQRQSVSVVVFDLSLIMDKPFSPIHLTLDGVMTSVKTPTIGFNGQLLMRQLIQGVMSKDDSSKNKVQHLNSFDCSSAVDAESILESLINKIVQILNQHPGQSANFTQSSTSRSSQQQQQQPQYFKSNSSPSPSSSLPYTSNLTLDGLDQPPYINYDAAFPEPAWGETAEPVVSTEYVESIVRDYLEPLLHDFLNSNEFWDLCKKSSKMVTFRNEENQTALISKSSSFGKYSSGAGSGGGTSVVHSSNSSGRPNAVLRSNIGSGNISQMEVTENGLSNIDLSAQHKGLISRSENNVQMVDPTVHTVQVQTSCCNKLLDCIAKIQHWAENCPYSQIRQCLSSFLSELSKNRKLPFDISDLIKEHAKSKYIPKDDINNYNSMHIVENAYRQYHANKMPRGSPRIDYKQQQSVSPPKTDLITELRIEESEVVNGESTDQDDDNGIVLGSSAQSPAGSANVAAATDKNSLLQMEKYKLYVWAFKLHSLRIPNVLYLLSYHPKYMATYLGFIESLQRLTFEQELVSYLGIMAAARFDCTYLIQSLRDTLPESDPFVKHGMEFDLLSQANMPPKQKGIIGRAKALTKLNALLAHAPWKINAQHIKDIVEGASGSKQWQQDKLIQAIIILAHYHSLSGFVLSCGVLPDNDFQSDKMSSSTTTSSDVKLGVGTPTVDGGGDRDGQGAALYNGANKTHNHTNDHPQITVNVTTSIASGTGANNNNSSPTYSANSGGVTPLSGRATPSHFLFEDKNEGADFIRQLESMPHRSDSSENSFQSVLIKYRSSHEHSAEFTTADPNPTTTENRTESFDSTPVVTPLTKSPVISAANRKYLGIEMGHAEFADQPTETNEESLVRMINSLDHLLVQSDSIALKKSTETRINIAYNLTYNSFGKYGEVGNVNTTSFRRTIPCSCLMSHGILYDDFNYELIEFFSAKHGRLFIDFAKRALVEPQTITRKFFHSCNPYGLDYSEMVHICILVMEARMQIELYYAMKAINDYRCLD